MLRRTFLGVALLAGAAPLAAQVAGDGDVAAVVTELARRLAEAYVVPATGRMYAAALRQKLAAGGYAGIDSPGALGARLTVDLQAVSPDRHLRVVTADALPDRERVAGKTPAPQGPPRAPALQDAGWIAEGVAYLRFTSFSGDPPIVAATAAFMRAHAGARALILDCRYNGGGGLDEMNVILPYLYAAETRLVAMEMVKSVADARGLPFEGPTIRAVSGPAGIVRNEHVVTPSTDERRWRAAKLFYLTSPRTASAAEHLALALKSSGRATLIGERTAGANHFGSFEPVGWGLAAFLPVGRTVDLRTGRDWEGDGIAPDVIVPPVQALQETLRRAGVALTSISRKAAGASPAG